MGDHEDPRATDESSFDELLRDERAAPRAPPLPGNASGLPAVGEVLDETYRIEAPLGEGGMGAVYRATHVGTGRAVALKVLVPELTANAAAVERFRREARAAGGMRHPNVVDVTDFGFAQRGDTRVAYLVMELLEGETLRALLAADRRPSLDFTVDVLTQVCAAVTEAHRHGILHRDLKPENIHVERGPGPRRVRVLDFGIAKLLQPGGEEGATPPPRSLATPDPRAAFTDAATVPAEGSLTRMGARIGTPRYMSPEQWRGEAVDERSDVYAVGLIAYEMLAGEPLVTDAGERRSAAATLGSKVPAVPKRIVEIVDAALADDPRARTPSIAAFAAGLHEGAETTWKLLRRSIAFSVDHYRALFRSSVVLTTVAMLPFMVLMLVLTFLTFFGRLSQLAGAGLTLLVTGGYMLATSALYPPVAGRLAVLVAEISAGRPQRRRSLELRRVVPAALPSAFLLLLIGSVVFVVCLVPQVIMVVIGQPVGGTAVTLTLYLLVACAVTSGLCLYPHAVVVERLSGLEPLRRSRALLRPMRRVAIGVTLTMALVMQAPPMVVGALSELAIKIAPTSNVRLALDVLRILVPFALTAVFLPFALVPGAMLYLRAREAEGKPFRPDADAPPTR